MGVDFLVCKNCGRTFCDCGEFVSCECGEDWCDNECAEEDGYLTEHCDLGCEDISWNIKEDEREEGCMGTVNDNGVINCYDCEHYHETSCDYCRGENYDNADLLSKAMELLNCDRQYLINAINKTN